MEAPLARKRPKQACRNCRRKKSRCPGERPSCSFCTRLKQCCEYDDEPVASKSSRTCTRQTRESKLADRIAELESKLLSLAPGCPSVPEDDFAHCGYQSPSDSSTSQRNSVSSNSASSFTADQQNPSFPITPESTGDAHAVQPTYGLANVPRESSEALQSHDKMTMSVSYHQAVTNPHRLSPNWFDYQELLNQHNWQISAAFPPWVDITQRRRPHEEDVAELNDLWS